MCRDHCFCNDLFVGEVLQKPNQSAVVFKSNSTPAMMAPLALNLHQWVFGKMLRLEWVPNSSAWNVKNQQLVPRCAKGPCWEIPQEYWVSTCIRIHDFAREPGVITPTDPNLLPQMKCEGTITNRVALWCHPIQPIFQNCSTIEARGEVCQSPIQGTLKKTKPASCVNSSVFVHLVQRFFVGRNHSPKLNLDNMTMLPCWPWHWQMCFPQTPFFCSECRDCHEKGAQPLTPPHFARVSHGEVQKSVKVKV